MDQAPQPEDVANTEREERRADVQRRIDEVAGVLAETLLGMWRAKHRAERRGEPWPPQKPPKPEPPRRSALSDRPKALRRAFRELAPGDEPVANVLLQAMLAVIVKRGNLVIKAARPRSRPARAESEAGGPWCSEAVSSSWPCARRGPPRRRGGGSCRPQC